MIPQFDILTIGAQVFCLLISLFSYYLLNIKLTIPMFIEVKKFRIKKLGKSNLKLKNINNYIILKSHFNNNFLVKILKL